MEISLATPLLSRDGRLGKDPAMVNCYWEATLQGGRAVVRRPALGIPLPIPSQGPVQGSLQQEPVSFAIINDTMVAFPPNPGANVPIPSVQSPGLRIVSVTNYNSSFNYLSFFKSTDQAWYWPSGGYIMNVTDADYPSMTAPGLAYLDGTYYVMDTSGKIYGSDLEDPSSWNALNFVTTDRGIGKGVALHRHLSYVTAFCDNGTQFFYDAANAYPGSPLSPVPNATSSVGCAHAFSIQTMNDTTIFMSKDRKRGRGFHMIQGLSMKRISTPDIDRILERNPFDSYDVNRQVMQNAGSQKTHTGYTQLYSMMLKADGHDFYIFTMQDVAISLVYDISNDHWSQWSTSYDGTSHQYFNAAVALSSYNVSQAGATSFIVPIGGGSFVPYGEGDVLGGEKVLMTVRTRPLDAGTTVRKTCSELSLLGDTVAATMNVRYSNDSGQTWSPFRGINLATARKRLTRLGTFVSRIYEFNCFTSLRVRIESMVLPDRNLPAQTQPSGE